MFLELCDELQKFIDKCSVEFYDRQTIDAIESIKNETIEVEDVVKYWEKAFKEVMHSPIKYFKSFVRDCINLLMFNLFFFFFYPRKLSR